MSNTTKNITNAGIAGAITGVTLGAAAVILSDKKRRNDLFKKANKVKDTVIKASEKFKDDKEQIADELETSAKEHVDEGKEKLKKSLS